MGRIIALAVILLFGTGARAEAHAFLLKASPGVGSLVERGATTELRLEFSEAVELAFSGVEVTGPSGAPIASGPIGFGDSAHRQLVTKLPALSSGNYRVKWHVVSTDTHRTEGAFSFTAKP